MYNLRFLSNNVARKFAKAVEDSRDETGYSKLLHVLKNTPKGDATKQKEIKKAKRFWVFDLSWGNRVVYSVYDPKRPNEQPIVIINFVGNHKDYMTYLRRT
jgi:hypothetical protein